MPTMTYLHLPVYFKSIFWNLFKDSLSHHNNTLTILHWREVHFMVHSKNIFQWASHSYFATLVMINFYFWLLVKYTYKFSCIGGVLDKHQQNLSQQWKFSKSAIWCDLQHVFLMTKYHSVSPECKAEKIELKDIHSNECHEYTDNRVRVRAGQVAVSTISLPPIPLYPITLIRTEKTDRQLVSNVQKNPVARAIITWLSGSDKWFLNSTRNEKPDKRISLSSSCLEL